MGRLVAAALAVVVLVAAACSGPSEQTEAGSSSSTSRDGSTTGVGSTTTAGSPEGDASSVAGGGGASASNGDSTGLDGADHDHSHDGDGDGADHDHDEDGGLAEADHEHAVPATVATVPDEPVGPAASALGNPSSGNSGGGSRGSRSGADGVWTPAPGTSWQWQLSGPIDTSLDVTAYDVDLFDTSDAVLRQLADDGRIIICYFSAGAWEDWRPDASSFDPSVLGETNGWPGERWLDIRRLDLVGPLIEARLDLAVGRGCDAVEPDNVDAYANQSGFNLTATDQIVFNSFLAQAAHDRGLSIGLKNAAELVGVLEPLYDWALVEECVRFSECASYTPFVDAGKAVFHVEYGGDLSYCAGIGSLGFSTLEKDLEVGPTHRPCPG